MGGLMHRLILSGAVPRAHSRLSGRPSGGIRGSAERAQSLDRLETCNSRDHLTEPGSWPLEKSMWRNEQGRQRRSKLRYWVVAAVAIVAIVGTVAAASATVKTPEWRPAQGSGPVAGPTTCRVGSGPYFPGYDPVTHDVYVPNLNSGNVTVLSGMCTLVGTIKLPSGAEPVAATFSPQNNKMYVTDDGLDQVYVISGLTITHTITSSDFTSPFEMVFDPGDSLMIVGNDGSNDVVAIENLTVAGTITVGLFPEGMCYDPFINSIMVVNYGDENVTALNAFYPFGAQLGTSPALGGPGTDPEGCAFDYADDTDYVTNLGGNNVTMMNGYGVVFGAVTVGALPRGIVWDQSNLEIYVADSYSGHISVIKGDHQIRNLAAGINAPEGMAFDDANNFVYVASFTSDVVYIET
jgi:DNA-binding beta-propeller fold protein YncE